ncbi:MULTISPECIES: hypothetical protein [Vibrio]|uniref:Uncharacterized protein n=1 Tax=Vibrio casei TaxID=673372 RepID=A0A368LJD5_9VIBR|nr:MULTISPECIES: hypothetical protein [Vibrio]RCS70746.1 hypothetical protein CIK83_15130 [Vibrio casei]SJN26488.1 hypothetical protein FM109_06750 [Vibrio casei]HBV77581.1 hypothetical protein [Vibrio sp.]
MKQSDLIKRFYTLTVKSTELAKKISTHIDEVRVAGIQIDHLMVAYHNDEIIRLSSDIQKMHRQREQISNKFGVSSSDFFEKVIKRLPEKMMHTMYRANKKLNDELLICKDKMEEQQRLMEQQHAILSEAMSHASFEIKA